MSALRTAIPVAWLVFWVCWMVFALGAKRGSRRPRRRPPGMILIAIALVAVRVFGARAPAVDGLALSAAGTALFAAGLALAVWARLCLGRNWGMPMTLKDEPELVTNGPYRQIRHPIYSGILLAMIGTALATELFWLFAAAAVGAYFVHSARVEERLMEESFPDTYPGYRARTKMLIPFLL